MLLFEFIAMQSGFEPSPEIVNATHARAAGDPTPRRPIRVAARTLGLSEERLIAQAQAARTAGQLAAPLEHLAVVGTDTAVEALAPRSLPLWPSYAHEATWLPPLAAALDGLRVLTLSGVAVFALDWLRRLTADYSRRRVAVALLLVVAFVILLMKMV